MLWTLVNQHAIEVFGIHLGGSRVVDMIDRIHADIFYY